MMSPSNVGPLKALFAQRDNLSVLRHLKLRSPGDVQHLKIGTDGSPFDEGGQSFFHRYGSALPPVSRWSLNICNLLVHERTSRIFALHEGRFTIALRPDVARENLDLCGPLRGETLDGPVDLSALGADWVLFHADSDADAAEAFLAAYEFAGRPNQPLQRTGAAGIVRVVRKLLGRGPGR